MTLANCATESETVAPGADVLIVGASARAAAHSAVRAGLSPVAIDRFGDTDLRSLCPTLVAEEYPDEIGELSARFAAAVPWMYTGALENYPELIERLATTRVLWGNGTDVLCRVRDFWQVHAVLNDADVPVPAVRAIDDPPPGNERWLVKSTRSSGGSGVHDWPPATHSTATGVRESSTYLQQHIAGQPVSAVFVATRGQCRLLGTSQQLIGTGWAGADGYRYVGSIASVDVPSRVTAQFERVGRVLTTSFGLAGLFGVDAIMADDVIWPVEVNPRYTASIETIERLTGIAAVDLHVRACRDGELPTAKPFANFQQTDTPRCVGKAILFARRDVIVTDALVDRIARLNEGTGWPVVADIPALGTSIPRGAPILTVFATSSGATEAQEQLQSTAGELESLLSSD